MHTPRLLRTLCVALLAGALALGAACATQSLDAKILTANQSVTVVLNQTDLALRQHAITPAQAQSVSTIAHQVAPLLDAARAAAAANDPDQANKTLALVNALLAGLQTYVPGGAADPKAPLPKKDTP